MKARLPWILLALSLALNVFFVGGAVWMKAHAGRGWMNPAERIEAAAKEFDLDTAQREALQHFLRTVRMRTRHLREQNQPLIDAAWSELAKPQPDDAALARVFDEGTANRRAYQLETSRALHEFLLGLSNEQRAKVLAYMRDRQNAQHLPPVLRQMMP
jgi:uncharacterized membrane protein